LSLDSCLLSLRDEGALSIWHIERSIFEGVGLVVDEGIVLSADSIKVEEGAMRLSVEEERLHTMRQILLMILGIHNHC
jgi:hypothetical protein